MQTDMIMYLKILRIKRIVEIARASVREIRKNI
jgi:hypothetical protein